MKNDAYSVSRNPVIKWIIGVCVAVLFAVLGGIILLFNGAFDFGANSVKSFDYSTVFFVMGKDNRAIRYDGFVCNGERRIDSRDDAIEAAKREIAGDENYQFAVYYDKENQIWAVHLGDQPRHTVVYISKTGQTVAILNG